MDCEAIIPYTCVFIDAEWRDLMCAARQCLSCCMDRKRLLEHLHALWRTKENPNKALVTFSVRTGLDLYLQLAKFPPGSEIIMSALNIPDMAQIIKYHGLKIVPLDVDLETTSPKVDRLNELISEKTVAIMVAHVFGKWVNMGPFIEFAQKHNLMVLEDCAESFCGFDHLSHPQTDVAFFSFGIIKFYTSMGGAVVKLKDNGLYDKMCELYATYPMQSHSAYLKKIVKYSCVYILLNCPRFIKVAMYACKAVNYDYKALVVNLLRGFPDHLINMIRQQPSTPLLYMMWRRQRSFKLSDFMLSHVKGEYVSKRLPTVITQVGTKAETNNYWLFPIVVENADNFVKILNALGVDAYRGATQMNIIEPDNGYTELKDTSSRIYRYPHEARFLIDHVVYLPVNKTVPFHELDQICNAVVHAVKHDAKQCNSPKADKQLPSNKVKLKSRL